MTDINKWANTFISEIKEKWVATNWENGFEVFYSPIFHRPDLLIIGLNPGGNKSDFVIEESCEIPKRHEYSYNNYKIATVMREILDKELINRSIKTNLFYFRSNSFRSLREDPRYDEIQSFCVSRLQEMISVLKPKNILAEGLVTFDMISFFCAPDSQIELTIKRTNANFLNHRLLQVRAMSNLKMIGITHPSSTRGLNNSEIMTIRTTLHRELIIDETNQ